LIAHRRRVASIGGAALASLALGASAAVAAPADATAVAGGSASLALGRLSAAAGEPVAIRALGDARRRGGLLTLPLAGGSLTSGGTVTSPARAGLALAANGRAVRLTALRLTLDGAPRITARVDRGGRIALLALARSPLASTRPLATRSTALRLTPAGARLLRTRLALERLPRGIVGTLRLRATGPADPATPGPASPAPSPAPAPSPPPAPAPAPAPAPPPVDDGPAPIPPPVFPAPDPGAVLIPGLASSTVVGGSAAWTFRGSWLRYLAAGGGSVATADGATKTADGAFDYPVAGGGYDSAAGWTIDHGGAVSFLYPNHGIEIVLAQPRIELGARAVVNVLLTDRSGGGAGAPGGGSGGGDGTPRRVDFATLDLSGIVPQRDGATVTWKDVPVLLTAVGAAPFLAYRAGEPFGRITIRATVAGG
jgi:hypothetical protein